MNIATLKAALADDAGRPAGGDEAGRFAEGDAADRHAQGDVAGNLTRGDMHEILRVLASMIGKSETAQAKFPPGTSQHTLQRNRLKALRIAEALIEAELDQG